MDEKLKKAYEEKINARLDETRAELAKLKAQADAKKADAKTALHRTIADLERERDSLAKKAEAIKSASGEAWEDLKAGLSDAADRMRRSLADARSKFR
jgi:ribosomal protein L29